MRAMLQKLTRSVDRPPQSPHPMHIDRPYNASALRAVKEAYEWVTRYPS
jgi:hypothetical protein